MKVLYLHQYFVEPTSNAGGTRSYEMARRLIEAGHQVTLLTSSALLVPDWAPTSGWHTRDVDGIRVEVLHVPYSNEMSFSRRIRAFLEFALGTAWRVIKVKADVVFATSTPLTIAIPGIAAKVWHRIPMVFEVRDLWPELPIAVGALKNPLFRAAALALEWFAYHASAHIVALSPGMAEGVVRRGISQAHVSIIPNACDVELFDVPKSRGEAIRQKLELAFDQPLILYAGTFGLINGVGYLVDVAAAMRSIAPDVRFLLVGSGAELELVTRQAEALGVLNHNVWIWPPIPKVEMPNLLSAATVATSVFLPLKPMWNNSANKFFDALASATPVAINYGGWQADLLKESGAGIVLPPDDPVRAAELLSGFVYDRERLARAAAASRQLARTEFARDLLGQKLETILSRVVQER